MIDFDKILVLSLQALPFSDALKLLAYLKEWAMIPDKVSLKYVCQCIYFFGDS